MVTNPRSTQRPAAIPVQHRWPMRLLRTLQFGFARLVSRDGYVEAHAAPFDLTFTGPAADCITRHIYRLGVHEPRITRYLIDHLRLGPEDIALDIGANIGWYSVLLNRLSVPGARIFAFEPDPESYRLLIRNLEANGATRVTALNVAIGDSPGIAELHRYRDRNNGRHTLLAGNTGGGIVRVPVTTLKDVWESQRLGSGPIRFLKIDVEGFEYFVLRGAGELLGRCACVVLEYSPEGLQLAGLKAEALIDLLVAAGLSARTFVNDQLLPISYSELARAASQHDLLLTPAQAS
ncbi:MAG: FkbM family methyltransferase [Gammaproteobacteria bacterium]|nr:MAG: FkbM family methyltransferase [Gammaproteobacteria bacterium]